MSNNGHITWTTESRKLSDLREWEKNPRQLSKHDAEHIKRSLDTFGLADPLIINRDNSLIGGHQRKRILANPDTLVDVRVPSRQLTEREAEELAIRLNKAQGSWDWDALANNWEMDTLIDWGFSEQELTGLDFGKEEPGKTSPETIPEQYMILIECEDEQTQAELLERFNIEGLKCRALIS